MKWEYGDIILHEVHDKVNSTYRRLISWGQFFYPGSRHLSNTVHVSIYIGESKTDLPVDEELAKRAPFGVSRHIICNMDEGGLKLDNVWLQEKLHVIRCKNSRLQTLMADLALSWAKASPHTRYAPKSRCIQTMVSSRNHQVDHDYLGNLLNYTFKGLPDNMQFICSELVITLYHLAIKVMDRPDVTIADYMSLSPLSSPSQFHVYLKENKNFIEVESLILEEEKTKKTDLTDVGPALCDSY